MEDKAFDKQVEELVLKFLGTGAAIVLVLGSALAIAIIRWVWSQG